MLLSRNLFVLCIVVIWPFSVCFAQSAAEDAVNDKQLQILKRSLAAAGHDTSSCRILLRMIDLEKNDSLKQVYILRMKKISEKGVNGCKDRGTVCRTYLQYLTETYSRLGLLQAEMDDYTAAESSFRKAQSLAENLQDKKAMADVLNHLGFVMGIEGKLDSSMMVTQKSLALYRSLNDQRGIAETINGIGILYYDLGEAEKALSHFKQSLGICRKHDFSDLIAETLSNIASISRDRGQADTALKYFNECLVLDLKENNPANIASSYMNIGTVYHLMGNTRAAVEMYEKAVDIQRKIGDKYGLSASLNSIGEMFISSEPVKATVYFDESLKLREAVNDRSGMATCFGNLGLVHYYRGNIPAALENYNKAIHILEKLGENQRLGSILVSIGFLYKKQGDAGKSLEYYNRAIELFARSENFVAQATALINVANVYLEKGDTLQALDYIQKSMEINRSSGNKKGIAESLSNLGVIYGDFAGNKEGYDTPEKRQLAAIRYLEQALELFREVDEKIKISHVCEDLGKMYMRLNNIPSALKYGKEALTVGKQIGFPENIMGGAQLLYEVYKKANDPKQALENFELYVKMRDSVNNENNRKASIRSQLKYDYEKQSTADSVAHAKESEIKNAELKKQEAEIKAKKNQQVALFGGLFLVVVFAGFMFNRWKVTQRQKAVIEEQKAEVETQKHLVEEKQKEILDSIHYARRIQMAQIPSEKRVKNTLIRLKT